MPAGFPVNALCAALCGRKVFRAINFATGGSKEQIGLVISYHYTNYGRFSLTIDCVGSGSCPAPHVAPPAASQMKLPEVVKKRVRVYT